MKREEGKKCYTNLTEKIQQNSLYMTGSKMQRIVYLDITDSQKLLGGNSWKMDEQYKNLLNKIICMLGGFF